MNDITTIPGIVKEAAKNYVSTVSNYQWELVPDAQLRAAEVILTKSDYIENIAKNDPGAVFEALNRAAVLGLDLTEGKRQGWLVPRKNQKQKTTIQLQVGYKGVEAIHQRLGVVDRLVIRVVRENDIFDWSGDDQEKPKHINSADGSTSDSFATEQQRGKIKGVYSITYFPNDSIHVMVVSIDTIYKNHRDRADSWKAYQRDLKANKKPYPPPWVTFEQAMIEKTMAFIAAKQWPANNRDEKRASQILETLHAVDVTDYATAYTENERDAFYQFINTDDGLGLRLMELRLDIEVIKAINYDHIKTIKKGDGRMEERDRINQLSNQGQEQLHNINQALHDDDILKLKENIEDVSELTINLLKAYTDSGNLVKLEGMLSEP